MRSDALTEEARHVFHKVAALCRAAEVHSESARFRAVRLNGSQSNWLGMHGSLGAAHLIRSDDEELLLTPVGLWKEDGSIDKERLQLAGAAAHAHLLLVGVVVDGERSVPGAGPHLNSTLEL